MIKFEYENPVKRGICLLDDMFDGPKWRSRVKISDLVNEDNVPFMLLCAVFGNYVKAMERIQEHLSASNTKFEDYNYGIGAFEGDQKILNEKWLEILSSKIIPLDDTVRKIAKKYNFSIDLLYTNINDTHYWNVSNRYDHQSNGEVFFSWSNVDSHELGENELEHFLKSLKNHFLKSAYKNIPEMEKLFKFVSNDLHPVIRYIAEKYLFQIEWLEYRKQYLITAERRNCNFHWCGVSNVDEFLKNLREYFEEVGYETHEFGG